MIDTPMCLNCKHFDFSNEANNTCAAFPDGIPAGILESRIDHRKPVAGDGGKRYEPFKPDWKLSDRLEFAENVAE